MLQRLVLGFKGVCFIPDAGYDSKQERQALIDVVRFNNSTGPLAGGVVFRCTEEDGVPCAFAWINPHYYDPIAVRLFVDGRAEWCFMDDPDGAGDGWETNISKGSLAGQLLEVVKRHHVGNRDVAMERAMRP